MKKLSILLAFCLCTTLMAQQITYPPSGGNQPASVAQYMGLVKVEIDYASPGVTSPTGENRRGHIWGELVPYGLAPNGFGTAKEIPWRAGANMNTVFTTSHAIEVEGKPLPAGKYSLHLIPQPGGSWTLIFNKSYQSWGSYFYQQDQDQLRVEVSPVGSPFQEDLTFFFRDRDMDHCTAVLAWEDLAIPFRLTVSKIHDYYIAQMGEDLKSEIGFNSQSWAQAATYCLTYNTHLDQALVWAENAISMPFVGQKNINNLQTKATVLLRMGKTAEGAALLEEAIRLPDATVTDIHAVGRQLTGLGYADRALAVFQYNAQRFPSTWPVNVGLARGYSATGNLKEALKYARLAVKDVPQGDDANAANVASMIKRLEEGKPLE